jgi:4-diphosphocytidyl-2-C-methyl-D-erythritol kinase
MDSIEVTANAKINLALAVKHKRDDGYHEIELIYQEVDFHDTLVVKKSISNKFSTDSQVLQTESSNLCLTAAEFLQKKFNIPGLDIYLEKRIPIGAGLGGGSSNAAAVLKGAMQLYDIEYSLKDLETVASKIGSDVPFFLYGGTAYGKGRGEILDQIQMFTDYQVLLVVPDIHISTHWAYKNLNLTLTRKNHDYKFKGFTFQNLDLSNFRSEFYNDFEKLVLKHHPQLASVKSELYDLGAEYVSLSGSGSALYGLYVSPSTAMKAGEIIGKRFKCLHCRPVVVS